MLLNHVSVAQTQHVAVSLADERIAQLLTEAFSPHRCTVEFQNGRSRVALKVRGSNGMEFLVEGTRVDLLRDVNALAQYIQDVKRHLSRHRVFFPDREPVNVLGARASVVEPYIKRRQRR